MPLIKQLELDPYSYLDANAKFGTFSVLCKEGNAKAHTKSYLLSELPIVLPDLLANAGNNSHVYISQAVFCKRNRQKVNVHSINSCFVDLDIYKDTKLAVLSPEAIKDRILQFCYVEKILQPSIVIFSGRGLYVKWFFDKSLPKYALTRWEAVQKELIKRLSIFEADSNARDISRVLRVVGSHHPATGERVRVLYPTPNQKLALHSFEDIAEAVLPYTRDELKDLRDERKAVWDYYDKLYPEYDKTPKKKETKADSVSSLAARGHTLNSLNWARVCDLQRLIELRGGDIGEGKRELTAFWLCNHFALRHYKSDLVLNPMRIWQEFYQLCRQAAPHWSSSYARSKVSNVYELMKKANKGVEIDYHGHKVTPLYRVTNERLINDLGITSDEQRKMATIIDNSEKYKRDLDRKEVKRRADGKQLRSDYEANSLTAQKPWEKLGMSRPTWYRKGKPIA